MPLRVLSAKPFLYSSHNTELTPKMTAVMTGRFTMSRRKGVDGESTGARQPAPKHANAHIEATAPACDHRGRKPIRGAGDRDYLSWDPFGSSILGLSLAVRNGCISHMDRENRIRQVAEYVRSQSEEVSVKDIAEALDLSKSYVRQLAREAREEGLIEGQKSKPVIGYIFEERGRARADGGERNGELRVLTTREALLQAVRDFAPDRYSEAVGKDLQELRKFVRNEVADGTVPVAHAWRFSA